MLLRFLLIISVIINYNIWAQDDRRDFDSELNYQSSAIDDVKKEHTPNSIPPFRSCGVRKLLFTPKSIDHLQVGFDP